MITLRRNPEVQISAASERCAKFIAEREGFTYRSRADVPVTLDGYSVSVDRLWLVGVPIWAGAVSLEYLCAAEVKTNLNDYVVEQIMRWGGQAHYRWAVVTEPSNRSKSHNARRDELQESGVGLMYFQKRTGECVVSFKAVLDETADVRLLRAAFDSSDGSSDPASGSAAALRATSTRTFWEPATTYLRRISPVVADWSDIRCSVKEMRATTCEKARKAIDRQEWLGVAYQGIPTEFFYAGAINDGRQNHNGNITGRPSERRGCSA